MPEPIARIWVRLPNWVGDIVMATPVLRAIRAAHPEARIAYCGRGTAAKILGPTPWHDAFILHARHSGLRGAWRAARESRAFAPDRLHPA